VKSPDFDSDELRSGDLLLSRGDAFTSAAIARVGDIEGQFSHLAMIYIDEKTHKKYTIEAHIEIGVVAAPFENYLADYKVRSTLFRFRGDPAIAHQAAKYMFEKARQATAAGANIPYDFKFNPQDESEVFCAEVAAMGYRHATRGKIELPAYESRITARYREFLNEIGMTMDRTFAPMDLEVDPHFDLVAEWRDLSRTHQSHRKDEVLTAIYNWMQRYHYVLNNASYINAGTRLLVGIRNWPFFNSFLKDRFPSNMSPRTMAAMYTISDVGETLFNDLTKIDEKHHQETGLWFTPKEMLDRLDQMRIDDLIRWKIWKGWEKRMAENAQAQETEPARPRFHESFHPASN
jgi:hypothetical protein